MEKMWRAAHDKMKQADAHYFQLNNIWESWEKAHPEAAGSRPNHHSGAATALIDHAVNASLAFKPVYHREPTGEGEETKAQADRLEKGLASVLSDAFLRVPYLAPKVNAKQLLRWNYTQCFVGYDAEALKRPMQKVGESQEDFEARELSWEMQHGTWNPIVVEVPIGGEVLMEPYSKIPNLVIRRKTLNAYDLHYLLSTKAEKGLWTGPFEMKEPYDEVQIEECWTPYWFSIRKAGGDLLSVERNKWGFVSFAQTFGGASDIPAGEKYDPAFYVGQSMLFTVMNTLIMADQRKVAQHESLIRAAYAKRGYRGDATEAAEQQKGDWLEGEEADYWVEKLPTLPAEIAAEGEEMESDIERATFALQAAGFRQSGVDTATQQIILSERTDRTFKPIVAQMEYLYSIVGSHVLKLVSRMGELYGFNDIQMGKHSLKAKDIGKSFQVTASFEQVDAALALQEKADARVELDKGLIDEDTYHVIARHENVEEIRRGIIRDRVRKMPEVQAELEDIALREEGFDKLADKRKRERELAKMLQAAQPAQGQGLAQGTPTNPAMNGGQIAQPGQTQPIS